MGPRAFALLGLGLLLGACGLRPSGPLVVVQAPGPEHPTGRVELFGAPAARAGVVVHVAGAPPDAPAVLGRVSVTDEGTSFVPRFPFERGLAYRLRTVGEAPLEFEFELPARELEPEVELVAVAPGGPELPANLLKFYLHFSGPMRRGEAYRHVRVLDVAGDEVTGALLRVEPELWNPERTRLTLLLDPGRIKQGLVPHEELGPVLHPGEDYVLEVDGAWRDGRGAPLVRGLRHAFRTLERDTRSPVPGDWRLDVPPAGTREPFVVAFDEALDRALVESLLWIELPDGSRLEGAGAVDADQTGWRFVPARAWRRTPHALVVPTVLEDLCGNSVGRPFEVPGTSAGLSASDSVSRAFTPR